MIKGLLMGNYIKRIRRGMYHMPEDLKFQKHFSVSEVIRASTRKH